MSTVDELLRKTIERIKARTRYPESTYRLQFHAGFTFRDALSIVPYLHELGITHCYASPYLKARPGSQHGYDITDHGTLNPEIGTTADFEDWVNALHTNGMGQILDMVPNHMGIVGNENTWWNDVLENGPSSPYAGYFDIAWGDLPRPELLNRVLLPFLGEPYAKVLEAQQIQLTFNAGSFYLNYFEHRFPVAPQSYRLVLEQDLEALEKLLHPDSPALQEYKSILTALSHLPPREETSTEKIAERQREKEVIKRRLAKLYQECGEIRDSIQKTITRFNGTAGDSHSFDLLDQLLDDQAYRLAYWRVASDEINYRRFFDVNELAALSMEKLEVFTATHALVLRLLAQGKIDGLRIDHPDGLYDPKQYLERLQQYYVLACARELFESEPGDKGQSWNDLEPLLLQQLAGFRWDGGRGPLYVVVEKILGISEELASDWKTNGTSGYNSLNVINRLFVDRQGEEPITRLYQTWIGDSTSFHDMVFQKKALILRVALSSELQMLARQLDRLAQKNRWSRDFTLNTLRFVLREVISFFPVYRSYISDEGVHETDRKYVESAMRRSIAHNRTLSPSLFRFVSDMLLLRYPEGSPKEARDEQLRFTGKFQQVTGPVMAKGLEDTTFYVYTRLLSLNEVGGDAGRFGDAPEAVHRFQQNQQTKWPWALSPLSTHDTKRSEDVRARLNVLSELPAEWEDCLKRWSRMNEPHRVAFEDTHAPDANEEYLIYQTLLGAWPVETEGFTDYGTFIKRIQAYMTKALHEAKVHSSWINPNEAYDQGVRDFIARILDEKANPDFVSDLRAFQRRICHFGLLNSLSQTLLKLAAPGAADTYQGTELWDFSLVDPDNRRPVDYADRQRMLRTLRDRLEAAGSNRCDIAHELTNLKENGFIKLYLHYEVLRCRRAHPGLFSVGDYTPIEVHGSRREHVFAFARRHGEAMALVAVPLFTTRWFLVWMGCPLVPRYGVTRNCYCRPGAVAKCGEISSPVKRCRRWMTRHSPPYSRGNCSRISLSSC